MIALIPRLHDTTGCQTGRTTGLTTVLNEQPLFVQPVVKLGCTTGLTTGCMYTWYSWLSNGFENWLTVCIHDTTGSQSSLTTGFIVSTNIYPVFGVKLSDEDIANFEVLRDVGHSNRFWLSIYEVHIPPGEYDWTVHVWRRCGLMSNYFDHLLLLARIAVLCL